MKSKAELPDPKRTYRQTARAAAAEANAQRIVEGFRERLERQWFDEIRLEDVAQDAGVTVQTVIRRFGGKDGLLEAVVDVIATEILAMRRIAPGDPRRAVRAVVDDYEANGDLVLRMVAQEARYPALRRVTDIGRREHRQWAAEAFAPWLDGLEREHARRRLDALVVATDLYVWQLVRRDMGRPAAELVALMDQFVDAAISLPPSPNQDLPR
ncbi:TetR/AcrR family transcriptional regulator [Phenylobacterium sp.]|uniref:TetR/AcrR family transcriptional regulator n=1 Tax=Phenylobacterium sp. TaxID=1871053 RepID=UPI0025E41A66|nr:TetR/AcrR family transcriptional regulator [Phenylobacterium sp.]